MKLIYTAVPLFFIIFLPSCQTKYDYDGKNGLRAVLYEGSKTVKEEVEMKDGKKHGKYIKFDKYKRVDIEGNFLNDKEEGAFNYYDDLNYLEKIEYYHNGVKDSVVRYFSESKVVKSRTPYKNGMINGTVKRYFSIGSLKSLTEFKNDTGNGVKKSFYMNGELQTVEEFVDGKQEGKHIDYYAKGGVKQEYSLKNGNKQGKFVSYYESGKKRVEAEYLEDLKHNDYYFYNRDGILIKDEYYDNGVLTGVQKYFHENGKQKRIITKNEGFIAKDDKEFDEDGKLIKQRRLIVSGINKIKSEGVYILRAKLSEKIKGEVVNVFLTDLKGKKFYKYVDSEYFINYGDYYELRFPVPYGYSLFKTLHIGATLESHYGHTILVYTPFKFSISNF